MLNPNKKPSQAHGTIVCNSGKDLHGVIDAILVIQEDWNFGRFDGEVRDVEMVLLREPYEFYSTGEGSLYDTLQNFFEKVVDTCKSNPEKCEYSLDDYLDLLSVLGLLNITLNFNDHEPTSKLLYTCNIMISCWIEEYTDGTSTIETVIENSEIKHYDYTVENLKKLGY